MLNYIFAIKKYKLKIFHTHSFFIRLSLLSRIYMKFMAIFIFFSFFSLFFVWNVTIKKSSPSTFYSYSFLILNSSFFSSFWVFLVSRAKYYYKKFNTTINHTLTHNSFNTLKPSIFYRNSRFCVINAETFFITFFIYNREKRRKNKGLKKNYLYHNR